MIKKTLLSPLLVMFLVTGSLVPGITKADCNKYEDCRKEVDFYYHQAVINHKSDRLFIKRLNESQDKWSKYVKSIFDLEYPDDEYFSGSRLCTDIEYVLLANERIKILKRYSQKPVEGELCWYHGN